MNYRDVYRMVKTAAPRGGFKRSPRKFKNNFTSGMRRKFGEDSPQLLQALNMRRQNPYTSRDLSGLGERLNNGGIGKVFRDQGWNSGNVAGYKDALQQARRDLINKNKSQVQRMHELYNSSPFFPTKATKPEYFRNFTEKQPLVHQAIQNLNRPRPSFLQTIRERLGWY